MGTPPLHILVAEPFDASFMERLRAVGTVTPIECGDEAQLQNSIATCHALLVRTRTRVTRALLDGAKCLRVIGRAGVGLDNIDLKAARQHGITVVYTPAAATEAVADLTLGLMIALVRRIVAGDAGVRGDRFDAAREASGSRELSELTLGVVGLGRIGRAVARRCRNGFGMDILYNDIVAPGRLDFVASSLDKQALYERSDIVSLHVPLTSDTRNLIDDAALDQFKPGAYLINTARGEVVDSRALGRALEQGSLAGAALDVFDTEPLPVDHVLMSAPNLVFTPHIGARTQASLAAMNAVIDDVIGVLMGKPPRFSAWS